MPLVFWLAVLLVGYPWIGYPLIVSLLAARRKPGRPPRAGRPRVSVIVAAFNEAATIAAKIDSALAQRYARDRLEVIVVSDGSTDGTDEIVRRYRDARVHLVRQEPRSGKSVALNRGVAVATGELLVFTDANALFAPDAIVRLAAPFADPRVGIVSGQGLYAAPAAAERRAAATTSGDAPAVSNGYVRYEARLRSAEAALGFMAGVDGAIYALRRSLYRDLDGAEVNDLLHPIQATMAGLLPRFVPDAYTVEPPSTGGTQEFGRHVRMIAQGMHIARAWLPRLLRARRWRAVAFLVSHRVLRWLTAPLLLMALAASLALARTSTLYAGLVAAQALFYATALAGLVAERRGRRIGPLAIVYYFCVVAVAGVAGFVRFLRSGAEAVWTPRAEARVTEPAA